MTAAVVVLAVAVVVLTALLLALGIANNNRHAEIFDLNAELARAWVREQDTHRLLPETATGTPVHDAVSRRLRVAAAAGADVLYAGPVAGGEGRG